jgi:hypothetical protein
MICTFAHATVRQGKGNKLSPSKLHPSIHWLPLGLHTNSESICFQPRNKVAQPMRVTKKMYIHTVDVHRAVPSTSSPGAFSYGQQQVPFPLCLLQWQERGTSNQALVCNDCFRLPYGVILIRILIFWSGVMVLCPMWKRI